MAKDYKSVEHRKVVVELHTKMTGQNYRSADEGRAAFDKAVAEAVRRELQRTERR